MTDRRFAPRSIQRFYDHRSTDPSAPTRRPHVGAFTPVIAAVGADLAAAVQTIREIGDGAAFDATVEDAFPGSAVESTIAGDGYFELEMRQHRLSRALKAAELTDGTLRVLKLAAHCFRRVRKRSWC